MDKNRFLIRRSFLVIISSFMLFAILSSKGWAECMVKNLSLEKKGDYTYFSIHTNGDFEFTHFIEPPKKSKPERIVIDLFDALHKLPKKGFYNLPEGVIKDIRTSQFQVTPKKITRVVLDLKKPVIYKVEEKDKGKVTFAIFSSDDKPFKIWTCEPSEFELSKKEETETRAFSQHREKQKLTFQTPEEKPKSKMEAQKPITEKKTKVFSSKSELKEKTALKTSEVKIPSEKQTISLEKAKKISEEKSEAKEKKLTQPVNPNLVVLPSWEKEKSISEIKSGEKEIEKKPVVSESDTTTKSIPKTAGPDTFLVIETLVKQKEKIKLDTIPKRKVLTYSSFGRKDPFVPLTEKISFEFGEAPLPNVESLKLVGVLEDKSGLKALLEDDQGYGYILEQGDRVKNGYVLKVFKDKIVFEITEYGWSRTVSLELSTEVKMER